MEGAVSKTTLYVPTADYRRLKELARRTGRSTAELVREAISEYARKHAPRKRPKSIGAGHSGLRDLGRNADKYLRGFGE